MRVGLVLAWVAIAVGCQPPMPPSGPNRAIVEVYMAKDGLTKCVDSDGNRWKADASCCPVGFSATGFSLRAATEFFDPKNEGVTRHLYRHLVCIQDLPPAPVSP